MKLLPLVLTVAAALLALPAVADRRGESICGEAPNRAILVTAQAEDGRWWAHGPIPQVRYPYNRTEAEAMDKHASLDQHLESGESGQREEKDVSREEASWERARTHQLERYSQRQSDSGSSWRANRLKYWESLSPDCHADYSGPNYSGRVRVYVLNHEIPTSGSTIPVNSAYPRQNMP